MFPLLMTASLEGSEEGSDAVSWVSGLARIVANR